MSKSTISTFELFAMFPDAESARLYFEARRWPDGPVCPACGEHERIYSKGGGFYRCNADLLVFTVRTSTIFEKSKVPLHKWLYAMYLLVTARKGISSLQLAKQIGVTQKTAWFMLQRLREAFGNDPTELAGIVEVDECYIAGRERETGRLDAMTDRVLAYHPKDKGEWAKRIRVGAKTGLVERESISDVAPQRLRRPFTELGRLDRADPIPDREDGIEVVVLNFAGYLPTAFETN